MNHVRLHTSADPAALAHAFASATPSDADPFARPLLLTPTPGVQRWLSQQVATTSLAGAGIMAGYDVHPWSRLEALLSGSPTHEDAWAPTRMVWAILAACERHAPGLEALEAHLASNDQRYANALRLARLLHRYADHRPAWLSAWLADPQLAAQGLGDHGWQPWLWHALHDEVSAPDPIQRRNALTGALRAGTHPLPWPEAHIFAPRHVTPAALDLVAALGSTRPVHVWLPVHESGANSLATALGRRAGAWRSAWETLADSQESHPAAPRARTALGLLQASILSGAPVPASLPTDDSLSIHSSHALGRQADVMRELLTGAFADDPTLEPRDAVVLTPDPAALAPHVTALFSPPEDLRDAAAAHPASHLRVAIPRLADGNQVYELVLNLLGLRTSRGTASELLDWAAHPFVARRFGFAADDIDRLEALIDAAGIRWGINADHRAWFGVEVTQNTWQLGVQRLILGEAFSDDTHTSVGVVATVDDVSSTDTDRVGALAELVSRLSRVAREFGLDAPVSTWVARIRDAVTSLTEVPHPESWQLSQVWSVLADIEERGSSAGSSLHASDVVALLTDAWGRRRERPAFGNGSLVVASVDDVPRIPHRLVCVVGLDERTFPRRSLGDGDDLLATAHEPLDPSPGTDDRQAILDAILAAQDRLILIYQGQSSLTPEDYPPPAGVLEVRDALGKDRVHIETLQPFSPRNFLPDAEGRARSFDRASYAAARALSAAPRSAPHPFALGVLPRTSPLREVSVEQLGALLKHPARFLLRERADLTLATDETAEESIPLELGFRESWSLGEALVASLLAGQDSDQAVTAQWLSGQVPPHELGRGPLMDIVGDAHGIVTRFQHEAPGEAHTDVVDLVVDGVRVTGQVVTRGGLIATAQYGRVDARHLGPAWAQMLSLTVATGRRTNAVVVGRGSTLRLTAPPVEHARAFLGDLLALAHDATEQVLPLPPRVAEQWARFRAQGRDPLKETALLNKLWRYDRDLVWDRWYGKDEVPWRGTPSQGSPWAMPGEEQLLGALAVRVWGPIVKGQG